MYETLTKDDWISLGKLAAASAEAPDLAVPNGTAARLLQHRFIRRVGGGFVITPEGRKALDRHLRPRR